MGKVLKLFTYSLVTKIADEEKSADIKEEDATTVGDGKKLRQEVRIPLQMRQFIVDIV